MNYVLSDLHGCGEKFAKMMQKLSLQKEDTLYVLGDTVDRGPDGIALLEDLMRRKNAVVLAGNHDFYAGVLLEKSTGTPDKKRRDAFRAWLEDGGEPTLQAFLKLDEQRRKAVVDFLTHLPVKTTVTAAGKKFHLSHTLPEKTVLLAGEAEPDDFLFGEPEYEKRYFDETVTVTGHTPTGFIDVKSNGRIWRGNGHIALDCGAVFSRPLGCTCLETGEDFYAS